MFHTELDRETARLADEIVNEFQRLEVSTDDHPCSGLMTRTPNIVVDYPVVEIYDDQASGLYDARKVLAHLKTLGTKNTSIVFDDPNNIWQQINEFEV